MFTTTTLTSQQQPVPNSL